MLENFSFTAAYGQMIRDGREAELVKDVVLAGNLFQTLDRIDHIAGDFRWNQMGGGCGKAGQFPLPVTEGAPHVRIEEALVGGDVGDRKSTRLNSSHSQISYAVFCLKKKNNHSSLLEFANFKRDALFITTCSTCVV